MYVGNNNFSNIGSNSVPVSGQQASAIQKAQRTDISALAKETRTAPAEGQVGSDEEIIRKKVDDWNEKKKFLAGEETGENPSQNVTEKNVKYQRPAYSNMFGTKSAEQFEKDYRKEPTGKDATREKVYNQFIDGMKNNSVKNLNTARDEDGCIKYSYEKDGKSHFLYDNGKFADSALKTGTEYQSGNTRIKEENSHYSDGKTQFSKLTYTAGNNQDVQVRETVYRDKDGSQLLSTSNKTVSTRNKDGSLDFIRQDMRNGKPELTENKHINKDGTSETVTERYNVHGRKAQTISSRDVDGDRKDDRRTVVDQKNGVIRTAHEENINGEWKTTRETKTATTTQTRGDLNRTTILDSKGYSDNIYNYLGEKDTKVKQKFEESNVNGNKVFTVESQSADPRFKDVKVTSVYNGGTGDIGTQTGRDKINGRQPSAQIISIKGKDGSEVEKTVYPGSPKNYMVKKKNADGTCDEDMHIENRKSGEYFDRQVSQDKTSSGLVHSEFTRTENRKTGESTEIRTNRITNTAGKWEITKENTTTKETKDGKTNTENVQRNQKSSSEATISDLKTALGYGDGNLLESFKEFQKNAGDAKLQISITDEKGADGLSKQTVIAMNPTNGEKYVVQNDGQGNRVSMFQSAGDKVIANVEEKESGHESSMARHVVVTTKEILHEAFEEHTALNAGKTVTHNIENAEEAIENVARGSKGKLAKIAHGPAGKVLGSVAVISDLASMTDGVSWQDAGNLTADLGGMAHDATATLNSLGRMSSRFSNSTKALNTMKIAGKALGSLGAGLNVATAAVKISEGDYTGAAIEGVTATGSMLAIWGTGAVAGPVGLALVGLGVAGSIAYEEVKEDMIHDLGSSKLEKQAGVADTLAYLNRIN